MLQNFTICYHSNPDDKNYATGKIKETITDADKKEVRKNFISEFYDILVRDGIITEAVTKCGGGYKQKTTIAQIEKEAKDESK
jgi:hypothetical protein